MDVDRFDQIARVVARPHSRRSVVRGLAGVAVLGLLGRAGLSFVRANLDAPQFDFLRALILPTDVARPGTYDWTHFSGTRFFGTEGERTRGYLNERWRSAGLPTSSIVGGSFVTIGRPPSGGQGTEPGRTISSGLLRFDSTQAAATFDAVTSAYYTGTTQVRADGQQAIYQWRGERESGETYDTVAWVFRLDEFWGRGEITDYTGRMPGVGTAQRLMDVQQQRGAQMLAEDWTIPFPIQPSAGNYNLCLTPDIQELSERYNALNRNVLRRPDETAEDAEQRALQQSGIQFSYELTQVVPIGENSSFTVATRIDQYDAAANAAASFAQRPTTATQRLVDRGGSAQSTSRWGDYSTTTLGDDQTGFWYLDPNGLPGTQFEQRYGSRHTIFHARGGIPVPSLTQMTDDYGTALTNWALAAATNYAVDQGFGGENPQGTVSDACARLSQAQEACLAAPIGCVRPELATGDVGSGATLDLAYLAPQPWDIGDGYAAGETGVRIVGLDDGVQFRVISSATASALNRGFVSAYWTLIRREESPAGAESPSGETSDLPTRTPTPFPPTPTSTSVPPTPTPTPFPPTFTPTPDGDNGKTGATPDSVTFLAAHHATAADAAAAFGDLTNIYAGTTVLYQDATRAIYTFGGQQPDGSTYLAVAGLSNSDTINLLLTSYYPDPFGDAQDHQVLTDALLDGAQSRLPDVISPEGRSPGITIGTTVPDMGSPFQSISGTSMSSPQAAGSFALLYESYTHANGRKIPVIGETAEQRAAADDRYKDILSGYVRYGRILAGGEEVGNYGWNVYQLTDPTAAASFLADGVPDSTAAAVGPNFTAVIDGRSSTPPFDAQSFTYLTRSLDPDLNQEYPGMRRWYQTDNLVFATFAGGQAPLPRGGGLSPTYDALLGQTAEGMAFAYGLNNNLAGVPPASAFTPIWDDVNAGWTQVAEVCLPQPEACQHSSPPSSTACPPGWTYDPTGPSGPGCYICRYSILAPTQAGIEEQNANPPGVYDVDAKACIINDRTKERAKFVGPTYLPAGTTTDRFG